MAALTAARQNPLGYDIRTEINGSLDSIVIGLDQRTPVRSVEPGGPQRLGSYWSYFPDRFEHAFKAAMSSFVQLARGEIASVCTARDSVEALRVAAAATVSAREHRPVSLTEMPALDTVA